MGPGKVAGLGADSRAWYTRSAWVSIPELTFAINGFTPEPFHSACAFCNVMILKDHTVEWVRFSHRNHVLSGLGMSEQGLALEFTIAFYNPD